MTLKVSDSLAFLFILYCKRLSGWCWNRNRGGRAFGDEWQAYRSQRSRW